MRILADIILQPEKAIKDFAKKGDIANALGIALAASILIALSFTLLVLRMVPALSMLSLGFFAVIFLMAFVVMILLGLLTGLVAVTLGGKGGHLEGIGAVSLSSMPFSLGLAGLSLLLYLPFAGAVAGFILAMFSAGISIAAFYRSIKEMFRTDMITSFIAVSSITMGIIAAAYLVVVLALSTSAFSAAGLMV